MNGTAAPLFLAALLALSGCVSPHTTLQPARPLAPGEMEVTAGASIPVHTSFSSEAFDVLKHAARRASQETEGEITEEEMRDGTEAALVAILLQPAMVPELQARVGVYEPIDFGIRYAASSWKFDGKVGIVHRERFDLAFSAGYVHHTGIGASVAEQAFAIFDTLRLVEYSRRDVDVAVLANGDMSRIFSTYGAARYIIGFPRIDLRLPEELAELAGDDGLVQFQTNHTLHYIGGTMGFRIGTETIAAMVEMSTFYMIFRPTVFGERRDLGGLVFTPALGVDVRF